MREALADTRGYLEELSKRRGGKKMGQRLVHYIYASDHLDRLLVRLGSQDRVDAIVGSDELRRVASELAALTTELSRWVREPATSSRRGDAEQAWRRLDEYMKDYRSDVLAQSVAGKILVQQSLTQLDAMRWLVRVAHHLWRLALHLELARTGGLELEAPGVEHEADA